jgi:hypothetical protein
LDGDAGEDVDENVLDRVQDLNDSDDLDPQRVCRVDAEDTLVEEENAQFGAELIDGEREGRGPEHLYAQVRCDYGNA